MKVNANTVEAKPATAFHMNNATKGDMHDESS